MHVHQPMGRSPQGRSSRRGKTTHQPRLLHYCFQLCNLASWCRYETANLGGASPVRVCRQRSNRSMGRLGTSTCLCPPPGGGAACLTQPRNQNDKPCLGGSAAAVQGAERVVCWAEVPVRRDRQPCSKTPLLRRREDRGSKALDIANAPRATPLTSVAHSTTPALATAPASNLSFPLFFCCGE